MEQEQTQGRNYLGCDVGVTPEIKIKKGPNLFSGIFLRGGCERKEAQRFEFTPPPQPDTPRHGPEETVYCLRNK
jgi:hypothetical protein